MIQTWAMLLDAYRELSAKRLFWLVLVLSGLVVALFGALGINEKGVTIAVWNIGDFGGFVTSEFIPPESFYKLLFSNFGIKFWLAWIATALALVSTASIFPDFIAGGSIELTLSKPITRFRLFLTKFVTGLLFVTLQVSVFCVASFLVIGIRGNHWEPAVFLAIPLVVVLFSYLFSVCSLLGLITRSTIPSLMLTLLFWLFLFLLNLGDGIVVQGRELNIMRAESITKQVERMERTATTQLRDDAEAERIKSGTPSEDASKQAADLAFTREQLEAHNPRIAEARKDLISVQDNAPNWRKAVWAVRTFKTILPKTTETNDLLDRVLTTNMKVDPDVDADNDGDSPSWMRLSKADQQRLAKRIESEFKERSVWWVLGTSLVFESVVLCIAGWMFSRRDF